MTKNLACIVLNHKWIAPLRPISVPVGEQRQQLMAVCSRPNCDARSWDYVSDHAS